MGNIDEILSEGHIRSIDEMSYNMKKICKLNEELTDENTRLLEELEKYDKQTKRILTIGVIVIFSLAILAILSKRLGLW